VKSGALTEPSQRLKKQQSKANENRRSAGIPESGSASPLSGT
jgi:hypothetical protein